MESNIENHRVRRVVLYYYLADDSLQVGGAADAWGAPGRCVHGPLAWSCLSARRACVVIS